MSMLHPLRADRQELLEAVLEAMAEVVKEAGTGSRSFLWSSGSTSNPKPFAWSGAKSAGDLDDWLCMSLDSPEGWHVAQERSSVVLTSPSGERTYLSLKAPARRRKRGHPLEAMLGEIWRK